MKKTVIELFIIIIFLSPKMINAIVWEVPRDFREIQTAINADSVIDGDTISVWGNDDPPFTYYENIDFFGKNILVVNRSYIANTGYQPSPDWVVIDGQQKGSVVTFSSGETRNAILKGFTIKNGCGTDYNNYDYGGGIFCLNSSPKIIMNHITSNSVTGLGGCIAISGGKAQPRICHDTIDYNYAHVHGSGIYFDDLADPYIDSNYIFSNGGSQASTGGGIACWNESVPNKSLGTIYANIIKGNISLHGYAVDFYNATPIIRLSVITENNPPAPSNEQVINCNCDFNSNALPDFGTDDDYGFNVFKDNAGGDNKIIRNQSSATVNAKGNYWATLNTDTIINQIQGSVYSNPIAASDRVASVSYNSACSTDVIVTGDLTVNQNVTLNIASGKSFKFTTTADTNTGNYNSCELLVHGSLQALGTEEDKINFTSYATSPQANDWYGIRLRPNSVGKFNNCNVKYGYCGIEAISNDTLLVDSSLIESNQTYGINIVETQLAEIKESEFNGGVYGIRATSTSPIIANNKFESNTSYGIFLEETEEAMILKNYLNGLSDAPTLYGIGLAGAGENVCVDSNRIEKWNQAGIYINQESRAQVNKDTIIDNTSYGILCCNSSSPKVRWCQIENNETGVYCENTFPDLGTEEDRGNNSIDLNNDYYVVNTSETNEAVSALCNWWGTDEPDSTKFLGLVDYKPWLIEPPEDGGQSAGIIITTPAFALYTPKPNPATNKVKISYSLPNRYKTELVLYDVFGRIVSKMTEEKDAGYYEYLWHMRDNGGKEVSSGIYFVKLQAGSNLGTRKILITR